MHGVWTILFQYLQTSEETQPQYIELQSLSSLENDLQDLLGTSNRINETIFSPTSQESSSSSSVALCTSTPTDQRESAKVVFPHNFVQQVLHKTQEGRVLLQKKALDTIADDAKKLSNLIIYDILEEEPTRRLYSDDFLVLSSQIVKLFPEENTAIYYVPYYEPGPFMPKVCAKGKLYDSYNKKKSDLRKKGILKKRTPSTCSLGRKKSKSSSVDETDQDAGDFEERYNNDEGIIYLQNHVDNWDLVTLNWEKTHNLRWEKLNKVATKAHQIPLLRDYYQEFRALQQPLGFELLLKDFNVQYAQKENQLFNNLIALGSRICNFARRKSDALKTSGPVKEGINNCLNELKAVPSTNDTDSTNNPTSIVALLLLPYLVAHPTAKGKLNGQPSMQDMP
ncbi:hypothetical protein M8J75_014097 [Diaphorina citri]|nr:hypothetical protein M8J75_014097 [Diaphorina citri]